MFNPFLEYIFRADVATLYDVFCELDAPKPGEKLAILRLQYPDDFHDPAIVKSVQQFAFPCQLREYVIVKKKLNWYGIKMFL